MWARVNLGWVKGFTYGKKLVRSVKSDWLPRWRPWDLWKKAFGFTPLNESLQRAQLDGIFSLREEFDKTLDEAVGYLLSNQPKEAAKTISDFNAVFPESSITEQDLQRRKKEREKAKTQTQLERSIETTPHKLYPTLEKMGIETPPPKDDSRERTDRTRPLRQNRKIRNQL